MCGNDKKKRQLVQRLRTDICNYFMRVSKDSTFSPQYLEVLEFQLRHFGIFGISCCLICRVTSTEARRRCKCFWFVGKWSEAGFRIKIVNWWYSNRHSFTRLIPAQEKKQLRIRISSQKPVIPNTKLIA